MVTTTTVTITTTLSLSHTDLRILILEIMYISIMQPYVYETWHGPAHSSILVILIRNTVQIIYNYIRQFSILFLYSWCEHSLKLALELHFSYT